MEKISTIYTKGGAYDIYTDGKERYIYIKKNFKKIIGSANARVHPKDKDSLGMEAKYYSFSKKLLEGNFIIFERGNDKNYTKEILEDIPEVKKKKAA